MYNMTTITLRELRHNFAVAEKAAARGPVNILRRGQVIATLTAPKRTSKGWPDKPDFSGRAIRTLNGPVDMLEFLDR